MKRSENTANNGLSLPTYRSRVVRLALGKCVFEDLKDFISPVLKPYIAVFLSEDDYLACTDMLYCSIDLGDLGDSGEVLERFHRMAPNISLKDFIVPLSFSISSFFACFFPNFFKDHSDSSASRLISLLVNCLERLSPDNTCPTLDAFQSEIRPNVSQIDVFLRYIARLAEEIEKIDSDSQEEKSTVASHPVSTCHCHLFQSGCQGNSTSYFKDIDDFISDIQKRSETKTREFMQRALENKVVFGHFFKDFFDVLYFVNAIDDQELICMLLGDPKTRGYLEVLKSDQGAFNSLRFSIQKCKIRSSFEEIYSNLFKLSSSMNKDGGKNKEDAYHKKGGNHGRKGVRL